LTRRLVITFVTPRTASAAPNPWEPMRESH
jgi:hypothetical protein